MEKSTLEWFEVQNWTSGTISFKSTLHSSSMDAVIPNNGNALGVNEI